MRFCHWMTLVYPIRPNLVQAVVQANFRRPFRSPVDAHVPTDDCHPAAVAAERPTHHERRAVLDRCRRSSSGRFSSAASLPAPFGEQPRHAACHDILEFSARVLATWGLRRWNRVRWSSEFVAPACLLDRSSARRHIFSAERMDLNASVEIAQLEAFQDPCFLG